VFFAFSYGSFIGFWGAHYCCEKMGCLTLASGNMTTEQRVKQIVEMGATVVCATPTYALRMGQTAEKMGIDLKKDGKVRRVIVSGEPAGSIPAVKKMIEDMWGGKCGDTAGMTEIGTIMIFECDHQPGGPHIIEDHFIEEVLDPDSGEPVPYGERGERVVTSFGRGFIPLVRYRTKDLVCKVPHTRCTCGRTGDVYEGGILGRVDDMKLIRGTNVYPRAVEAVVREHAEVEEFQIVIQRVDNVQDEITVKVELKPDQQDCWPRLQAQLGKDLADAHEGLRFNVEPGRLGRRVVPGAGVRAGTACSDRAWRRDLARGQGARQRRGRCHVARTRRRDRVKDRARRSISASDLRCSRRRRCRRGIDARCACIAHAKQRMESHGGQGRVCRRRGGTGHRAGGGPAVRAGGLHARAAGQAARRP